MSQFLAILTAGLISLHALLGCCGLHLCELDAAEPCQMACDHQDCEHQDWDHEHSDHEDCNHEDTDGPGDCCLVCRGANSYLPPEKPQVDDCFSFVATVIPTALSGLGDYTSGAGMADMQRTALGPPLRLHLLNQILLI